MKSPPRLYHQAAKALGGGTAVNAMGASVLRPHMLPLYLCPSPRHPNSNSQHPHPTRPKSPHHNTVWTWGDRADWELIDLEGWSFEDVYPYFLKSENFTGHSSGDHRALSRGHDGPVTLTSFPPNAVGSLVVFWVGG